jgi:hypothetical protein
MGTRLNQDAYTSFILETTSAMGTRLNQHVYTSFILETTSAMGKGGGGKGFFIHMNVLIQTRKRLYADITFSRGNMLSEVFCVVTTGPVLCSQSLVQ